MDYLYDESFDGLLTCIYHHYYQVAATGIYPCASYQAQLMVASSEVKTDLILASRVYKAIENKISASALLLVYQAFLSALPGKENLILNYLLLGFKLGSKVNLLLTHPAVYPLHKIAAQVSREQHRFLGLLRFADTGGFLYAACAPDHHILPLIADHFADRLAGEKWIIHDRRRKLAAIYNGQIPAAANASGQSPWALVDFPYTDELALPQEEKLWQELWQHYFREISIGSRHNPRLQAQFLPHRYRPHLSEFQTLPQRE